VTSSWRFCPQCRTPRLDGAGYCGECGFDFDAPRDIPAKETQAPAPPTTNGRRRSRVAISVAAALVICAVLGAGALLFRPAAGQTPTATIEPEATIIALTSPPPMPEGVADPSTPAYNQAKGFSPDAQRILTAAVLRLSLERYRQAAGAYPSGLVALFPVYAPTSPDGVPMTSAPTAADGYTYVRAGDGYTLSVTLASGRAYTTTSPSSR
jgi:hypothetical protein